MKKPYISIVDDDSGFANYLRTFLSLRGYETRSYSRGDEIVASVKQGDPPDVVLLDVMMPGMNGLETLRALKAAKPDLQVIMLSGREQASTIVEAVRLGAADYVVKPDDPEGLGEIALDAAIKSAIEKTRLVSEITELRRQLNDDQDRAFLFWGDSPEMQTIASVIEQVSDSDVTVLIRGESGVGKELVARAIHQRSSRKERPFVKVNCAALPAELLESELFGHEKGAFTGAATTRIGKFEQADTGTIFLDEIGEMKAALQAKLLHVLQDAQFTKLGSNRPINVDVRVVAATNRDLETMMLRGEFREDLYYRLKVIEVTVPPLRERRSEIAHLTRLLHRPLRPPLQPAGPPAVRRTAAAVSDLRVAGQHPRAREHDQADRHPAGRVAGHPRDVARPRDRSAPMPQPAPRVAPGRRGRRSADEPRGIRRRRDRTGRWTSVVGGRRGPPGPAWPTSPRRRRSRPSARSSRTRCSRCTGTAAARPNSSASATRRCSTESKSAASAANRSCSAALRAVSPYLPLRKQVPRVFSFPLTEDAFPSIPRQFPNRGRSFLLWHRHCSTVPRCRQRLIRTKQSTGLESMWDMHSERETAGDGGRRRPRHVQPAPFVSQRTGLRRDHRRQRGRRGQARIRPSVRRRSSSMS